MFVSIESTSYRYRNSTTEWKSGIHTATDRTEPLIVTATNPHCCPSSQILSQNSLDKQHRPRSNCFKEAVWSGSSLFTIVTSILLIPSLKTKTVFEKRKRKVFEILEPLLYLCFWWFDWPILLPIKGGQWHSGRVLDSSPKGREFKPRWRHCVVSSGKTH